MATIANAARRRRIALGLTQDQAAAAADLSRKTISDFEVGRDKISLANLNRLLRAMGLELTLRDAVLRPTLDEVADRYRGDEEPPPRQRARPKKAK